VLALHRRLRAPPVVAATRRLFPAFVALAMGQDPGTMATDGVKYEMRALPEAFVLAQHPHRFRHREALGQMMMGESAREEQEEAQIALMDAGAALAETFEALLNEFRLRPRRRYARMTPADAPGGERISPPLLLQLRAYEDAVASRRMSRSTSPSRRMSRSTSLSTSSSTTVRGGVRTGVYCCLRLAGCCVRDPVVVHQLLVVHQLPVLE
jgi:hypothetical protein